MRWWKRLKAAASLKDKLLLGASARSADKPRLDAPWPWNQEARLHRHSFPLGVSRAHYRFNKHLVKVETPVTFIMLNSFGNFQRKLRHISVRDCLHAYEKWSRCFVQKRLNLQNWCKIILHLFRRSKWHKTQVHDDKHVLIGYPPSTTPH